MNKIIYTFGILIFTSGLLISCGSKEEQQVNEVPSVQVKLSKPSTQVAKTLSFKGKIKAAESTSIRTRGSSFVEEVYVKTGDQVRQGDLLIRLNNTDLQAKKAQVEAQIQQINAQLNNTQRDVKRYQNLYEKQSISAKELENIELQLVSVKAQKQAALQQLQEVNSEMKYYQIKAPFNGVITAKNVQKGDLANPQQAMLQLEGKSGFEIEVLVSERDIDNFQQGDSAVVRLDDADRKLTALISEVSSSSTSTGGQYKVKASITNTNNETLFAGMNASLSLKTDQLRKGIFVPKNSIIRRGELKGLYVVSQQNTALLRWVRVGGVVNEHIEILSGLAADEQIIILGESKLYNGINISY
ncbi:efflux RND transporter periplasmic adaptor subunit [Psychroflexus salis]|uniref:RND transporter n=1 Tax=Psychroflexus salis TaxID=1526574 RepID=A0A916ZQI8_9FLAO|nr:efflux RND transporter periplasmic adaptor subunit [Psychroflexus salis]GGE07281.1 RND transporter [Psychroflexus salis]